MKHKKAERREASKKRSSLLLVAVVVLATVQIVTFLSVTHHNHPNPCDADVPMKKKKTSFTPSARRRKRKRESLGNVSGTFNGYRIYYKDGAAKPIHSSVQCVGHNFQTDLKRAGWIHRSCKFRHFCFDTREKEFVLFRSPQELRMHEATHHREFMEASTSMNTSVAIGGINSKWTWREGVPRLEWFPKVVQGDLQEGYYELEPNVVWAIFHSLAAFNPGHLVWDDFLPIYTLLRMFNLLDDHQLLMMRYVLKGKGLWASCDMNSERQHDCAHMLGKFLPLMGLTSDNFTTNKHSVLKDTDGDLKSHLVCARHGVAGIGMLTDHGVKLHGWHTADFETMHNHGRGPMFYDFRNFMFSNLGLPSPPLSSDPPYVITFSLASSVTTLRQKTFENQTRVLAEAFGDSIEIRSVEMKLLSVEEQVKLASQTAIYVTVCGGGAVTATFLPVGATVIIYYQMEGGRYNSRRTFLPARLDWDFFNNAAYLRPHWLPAETSEEPEDLDAFVKLVEHELDIISHQE